MKVQNGNHVRVHYKGTLDDGTIFDESRNRGATLDFQLGSSALLPAFEAEVAGMKVGQVKKFKIDNAYGDPIPDAVVKVEMSRFPDNFSQTAQVGHQVQGMSPSGQPILATVTSIDDDGVTLDHNHPLAGKDLNFEVELVEIVQEEQE